MTWLYLALRILLGVAGALCLYGGLCLYVDEERVIQSKLEDWWVELHELQQTLLSRQTAFSTFVSIRIRSVSTDFFGKEIWSWQAADAAADIYIFTYYIIVNVLSLPFMWMTGLAPYIMQRYPNVGYPTDISGSLYALLPICIVLLPRLYQSRPDDARGYRPFIGVKLGIVMFLMLCVAAAVSVAFAPPDFRSLEIKEDLSAALSLVTGAISGVLLILAMARVLRYAADETIKRRSEWPLFIGLLAAWTFNGLLCYATFMATRGDTLENIEDRLAVGFVLAGAFIPTAWTLGILAVAILLVIHRCIWPLTTRILYSLPRHEIVKNKKALNKTGITLLLLATLSGFAGHLVEYMGKLLN